MQQSSGRCTALFGSSYRHSLDQLAAFACWLPRHAGLISSLEVIGLGRAFENWRTIEQLVASALMPSISSGSTAGEFCSGKPAAPAKLQICSFSGPCWFNPTILEALRAAGSLTALTMVMANNQQQPSAAVCAALASMSTLHSLQEYVHDMRLANESDEPTLCQHLAAAVQQLQQLTSLVLPLPVLLEQLQLLPRSLQHLHMCIAPPPASPDALPDASVLADLSPLTALKSLDLHMVPKPYDDTTLLRAKLPDQLQGLSVIGPFSADTPCQHLRSLKVRAAERCLDSLQHLSSMTALRQLEVCGSMMATAMDLVTIVNALGTATQLTHVVVDFSETGYAEVGGEDIQLGDSLSKLVGVQHLMVANSSLSEGGVLQLTALTKLTALHVTASSYGLTSMAVVALACRLRRLQSLSLLGGCLAASVLPALGSLPELQHLDLSDAVLDLTPEGLQQLSSLTRLTTLYLSWDDELPHQTRADFVESMPHLMKHNLL